ncbi:MAG: hypothetical protein ACYTF1_16455 [Planctomycetota bacterium]|jgi:hypothetical protein
MNNKKKYAYILLVVISGGAFVVDRLFLSKPETATAQTVQTIKKPADTLQDTKESGSTDDETLVNDPSLDYLEKLPDNPVTRDVFLPTQVLRQHYDEIKKKEEELENINSGPKPGSPEAFEADNKLQATFISNGPAMAVINDNVYQKGDLIGEFKITKIDSYGVTLRRNKDAVILSLPVPTQ